MIDKTRIIKEIVDLVKEVRVKRSYIRITEYPNFYFVATDDFTDPMIFDKNGCFTGKNFVEIDSKYIKNPKEVFFEEGKDHEK